MGLFYNNTTYAMYVFSIVYSIDLLIRRLNLVEYSNNEIINIFYVVLKHMVFLGIPAFFLAIAVYNVGKNVDISLFFLVLIFIWRFLIGNGLFRSGTSKKVVYKPLRTTTAYKPLSITSNANDWKGMFFDIWRNHFWVKLLRDIGIATLGGIVAASLFEMAKVNQVNTIWGLQFLSGLAIIEIYAVFFVAPPVLIFLYQWFLARKR